MNTIPFRVWVCSLATALVALLLLCTARGQPAPPPSGEDATFFAAVASGDPDAVKPLLRDPGSANALVPPPWNPKGPNPISKQPALIAAARAGHAGLVRLLIASGADLRSQGAQALAEAVAGERAAVVKALLEAGVRPQGSAGDLRMASAVTGGSVEIAELLLRHGGNLAKLPGPVWDAAANGGSAAMRAWLRKHDVALPEETSGERLLTAIRAGDLPAVQRLMSKSTAGFFTGNRWDGMTIHPTDLPEVRKLIAQSSGAARSAGAAAAATGNKELLTAIVGAAGRGPARFVNEGDALLRRPLWFAATRGDLDMTERLLAQGAVVDAATFSGQTALGVATSLGHQAVADVLLKHGARQAMPAPERSAEKTAFPAVTFPKGFRPPAVAMMPVSIVDGWHASTSAANDLGAALEAASLNLPEVRWIERAEIERIGGEWATEAFGGSDPALALQKGRLAHAEWMVTTRILPDEGRGRFIVFEVLDTHTAESLAQHTVALPGRLGWPLKFEPATVPALLAELRSVLAAAAHTVEGARGRQRLACLFFANKAPTDRFTALAGEAMETISAVAESPDAKLPHVVRFRRSRAAAGEAELAAAGWLDQGEQALQEIAGAFAWGSITEVGNGSALRDDVMIRLTWEVWTGGDDTAKHEAVCRAGDAAATMRVLSKKVLTSLPPKGSQTNLKVREAMAQRMRDQARALAAGNDNPGSAEARLRWRTRVAMLEAAHFLNPENTTLEAGMIVERWHLMQSTAIGTSARSVVDLQSDFQRLAAWDRFAKAHGYEPLRAVFAEDPSRRERWPWPQVVGESRVDEDGHVISTYRGIAPDMTLCHAELVSRLINEIQSLWPSVPSDLPPGLRETWLANLGNEYAELMATAAKTAEGALNLRLGGSSTALDCIPDKALRYRTAVVMLRGSADRSRQNPRDWDRYCSELLALAEDAGLADEALDVVREARAAAAKNAPAVAATQPSKPAAGSSTWQIEQNRMAEHLAAEKTKIKGKAGWLIVEPELRELTGSYRSGTVVAMSFHRGKLYLAVRGNGANLTTHTTLWEHDPAKGTFTLLSGLDLTLPQDHFGLTAHDTGLWLWSSLNGIWRRDWDTRAVTHHESKSGLPTDHIFSAANLGGTLFFGGGKQNDPAVFSWDATNREWRVLPRPASTQLERATSMLGLMPMGDELFVQTFPTYAALNPKTARSRDLSSYLIGNRIAPLESLATGKTLWSWGEHHFARIDLTTMTHRPVAPAGDAPAVTGFPCFLIETEDCIWAITRDTFLDLARGLNIHRLFAVKKSDGAVSTAVLLPMACRIQCATVVDKTLWLGVARGQSSSESAEGLPCLIRIPLPL